MHDLDTIKKRNRKRVKEFMACLEKKTKEADRLEAEGPHSVLPEGYFDTVVADNNDMLDRYKAK